VSGIDPVLIELIYTTARMVSPTMGIRKYKFFVGFTVRGIVKGYDILSFFIAFTS
jgi:hypothetical protein